MLTPLIMVPFLVLKTGFIPIVYAAATYYYEGGGR